MGTSLDGLIALLVCLQFFLIRFFNQIHPYIAYSLHLVIKVL